MCTSQHAQHVYGPQRHRHDATMTCASQAGVRPEAGRTYATRSPPHPQNAHTHAWSVQFTHHRSASRATHTHTYSTLRSTSTPNGLVPSNVEHNRVWKPARTHLPSQPCRLGRRSPFYPPRGLARASPSETACAGHTHTHTHTHTQATGTVARVSTVTMAVVQRWRCTVEGVAVGGCRESE